MPREPHPDGGAPAGDAAPDVRELAMHGGGLSAAAGGIAHQVRNPLNAMVLQLALLADKIGAQPELAEICATHLSKLRDQVGRVDEVLRRFVDLADPGPGSGLEVARLLDDAAALFVHEARQRHLALEVVRPPPGLRVRGDPARIVRLWIGLAWRAIGEVAPDGGLVLSAAAEDGAVALRLAYARDGGPDGLSWVGPAVAEAAQALGGRLEERVSGGQALVVLRLPAEAR